MHGKTPQAWYRKWTIAPLIDIDSNVLSDDNINDITVNKRDIGQICLYVCVKVLETSKILSFDE
jgi:hypothetical protein